jgi:3-dehydroquinate synthetase
MRFAAHVTKAELAQVDAEAADGAAEFAEAQGQLLDMLGLQRLAVDASPDQLLDAMKHDKKVRGGELRFVLAGDVAKWRVVGLSDQTVMQHLRDYCSR